MLAAHMGFESEAVDRVGRFWGSDRVARRPGLKAVDLFDAVADGRIKALWIMATNPVDSMPDADRVRAALRRCPFVVVSDMNAHTDTITEAHVRLPAAGWGEKDGTVTNSERRISRQRPFLTLPGEARPDWWIVAQVAQRMGFGQAFAFEGPAAIFGEHSRLSAFENEGSRDFDLSGLSSMTPEAYDRLAPVQWPVRVGTLSQRLFADGRFFTEDGRANIIAIAPPPRRASTAGRLVLNTGRVRDHWHTMTRTGKTPRLSAHLAEPFAELHPDDATRLGIEPATLVRLECDRGSVVVRALVTDRQSVGTVFVPMHWTDQFTSAGRVDVLMGSDTDPYSGQPALKMGKVSATPALMRAYGFTVSRRRPLLARVDYWAAAPVLGGHRLELAWAEPPEDWEAWAREAFLVSREAPLLSSRDRRSGRCSFARFDAAGLDFAIYFSPEPVAVSRQFVVTLLVAPVLDALRRSEVLAGRPGSNRPESGPLVCACYSVGANTIAQAVRAGECRSVEEVGTQLKAGTNCGSCRAEIAGIINRLMTGAQPTPPSAPII